MREILFRGKRTDCGEWVEGYLNQHRGRVIFDCCCNAINANDYYINDWTEKLDTDLYGCVYKVIPETVGQFTGLTDKNGVRIFEGDILRGFEYPFRSNSNGEFNYFAEIVWFDDSSAFGIYTFKNPKSNVRGISEGNTDYLEYFNADKWEVIGNIHDNPELLR